MVPLTISLFGSPSFKRDGIAIHLHRRKTKALLAYLTIGKQRYSRNTLATLLWPSSDQAKALANLRRDLSELNKILGEGALYISRSEIGLKDPAAFSIDIDQFKKNISHVRQHFGENRSADLCDECSGLLDKAIQLYKGDFLAGFSLSNNSEFNEWQFFEADQLRRDFAWALEQAVGWYKNRGELKKAIPLTRRWVALDPMHEPAHRALMTLFEFTGQHSAALRQYAECVRILQEELGVEPEAETVTLYEKIQKRQLSAPNAPVLNGSDNRPEILRTLDVIKHKLPAQPTRFLGREKEVATVDKYLAHPDIQLVTILGAGGMGKTRLAHAVAEQQLAKNHFPHGIYFVPLAQLSTANQIIPTMADALDFPLETGGEQRRMAKQQVLDYLREKEMLLLLDNFEHLLDGVELVADILQTATKVKLLVTSRERLHLHQEQLFTLHGLDTPQNEKVEDFDGASAVQLFLQSAGRVKHDFQLEDADKAWLVRLCHLVAGMPLALELAAGWADTLTVTEIAQEIQQDLDLLETEALNVPNRQRSIRAVFDGSWKRLSSAEQRALAQFSIFRGGFTRKAARAITKTSLRTLGKLVNKSLLQFDSKRERYSIHELLRQYGAEQLAQDEGADTGVKHAHSKYYLKALAECEERLKGTEQLTALADIESDIENARLAWQWGTKQKDVNGLAKAMNTLGLFFEWNGRYQDGASAFNELLDSLKHENTAIHAQTLIWSSTFAYVLNGFLFSQDLLEKAKTILEDVEEDTCKEIAFLHFEIARQLMGRDYAIAESSFAKCLKIFRELEDDWAVARTLHNLGETERFIDRQDKATDLLEESLNIHRRTGNLRGLGKATLFSSAVARYSGDSHKAVQLAEECLEISRHIGNRYQIALALRNLALCHDTGFTHHDIAHPLFTESLNLVLELSDPLEVAPAYMYLGNNLFGLVDDDNARRLLKKGLSAARENQQNGWISLSLKFLGDVEVATGNISLGRTYWEQSKELFLKSGQLGGAQYLSSSLNMISVTSDNKKEIKSESLAIIHDSINRRGSLGVTGTIPTIVALLMHDIRHDNSQIKHIEILSIIYTAIINIEGMYRQYEIAFKDVDVVISRLNQQEKQETDRIGKSFSDRMELAKFVLEELIKLGWETSDPAAVSVSQFSNNLQTQPTPFLGREQEINSLSSYLADPNKQLVTILGAGGMGKTRLALALAELQLSGDQFPDGIFFVPLAPLGDPDHIPAAMAEAFDLPLETSGEQRRTPKQQVLDYLKPKRLLLVLDNFEHLLRGVSLINDIRQLAPEVHIIVTSRERLQLQAEQLFRIHGLAFPNTEIVEDTADFAAVQLFVQRAQQVKADFELQTADLPSLSRICRLVAGMPLALELAAGWVDTLSLADIARELQQNLDLLTTEIRDVPDRQRSMRAVFDTTWSRLSPAEQTLFPQLSVFRGGFTRKAGQAITGASLSSLSTLANKSLLHYNNQQDRYEIHELVRQYGAERLTEDKEQKEKVRAAHGRYYLEALADRENKLKGSEQLTALAEIEVDIENACLAWHWGIEDGDVDSLAKAMGSLGLFFEWNGRYQDGAQYFQIFLDASLMIKTDSDLLILARAFGWESVFQKAISNSTLAFELLENGLKVLERLPTTESSLPVKGILLLQKGRLTLTNDYAEAQEYLKSSLGHFRDLNDSWNRARILQYLGEATWGLGKYSDAIQYLDESITLHRSMKNIRGLAKATLMASMNERFYGNKQKALKLAEECVETSRKLDDANQLAFAFNNLAHSYGISSGQHEKAFKLQKQSADILINLANPIHQSQACFGLGSSLQNTGQFEDAIKAYERGITSAKEMNQPFWWAICLVGLGQSSAVNGKRDEGCRFLKQANQIFSDIKAFDSAHIANIYFLAFDSKPVNDHNVQHTVLTLLQESVQKRSFFILWAMLETMPVLLFRQTGTQIKGTERSLILILEIMAIVENLFQTVPLFVQRLWGKELLHLSQTLPKAIAEDAQERGRQMDEWEMASYLLDQLPKLGWLQPNPS